MKDQLTQEIERLQKEIDSKKSIVEREEDEIYWLKERMKPLKKQLASLSESSVDTLKAVSNGLK